MENKVVTTLARALRETGIPTLRFNFRGVGASAGTFDEGGGETEDAAAVPRPGRCAGRAGSRCSPASPSARTWRCAWRIMRQTLAADHGSAAASTVSISPGWSRQPVRG